MSRYLALLLLIPSMCQADSVLSREIAFDTLMAIDYRQTEYIFHSHGKYWEMNPYIRSRSVGQYFLTATLVHAGITYTLPRKYQRVWQWSTIIIEGAVVGHNAYIGIGIRW